MRPVRRYLLWLRGESEEEIESKNTEMRERLESRRKEREETERQAEKKLRAADDMAIDVLRRRP